MTRNRQNLPREVPLRITGLTPEGLGIADLAGKAVHVRNGLPGELVTSRILRRRKGILFADGVEIAEPSSNRQKSACAHFPRCGGCNMHHVVHGEQLALKQAYLKTCLDAAQIRPARWLAPVGTERLGYRTKARLGVRRVGEEVLVGFRESFSNRVARLQACQTLTRRLAALLGPLRNLIAELSCADKVPQVELAQGSNDVALMLRHLQPLTAEDITRLQLFAREHRLQLLSQSGGYDTLQCVEGGAVKNLSYTLPGHGLYLEFHPAQFTQVNHTMNRRLIDYALGLLGDLRGARVLDLFCGIGNFSLPLARAGARVVGLEVAQDAVTQAAANAALNGLSDRVGFAAQDLYADALAVPGELDAVLLDPPRSGAGPQLAGWLQSLRQTRCRTIVYVSCNPVSFANDAGTLQQYGYELTQVGVFDMFPHTGHVETMGHFVRRRQ